MPAGTSLGGTSAQPRYVFFQFLTRRTDHWVASCVLGTFSSLSHTLIMTSTPSCVKCLHKCRSFRTSTHEIVCFARTLSICLELSLSKGSQDLPSSHETSMMVAPGHNHRFREDESRCEREIAGVCNSAQGACSC